MNTRTCTRLTSVILLALLAYAPATYAAGSITDSFAVTATVPASCTVSAGRPLVFGTLQGRTSITVACSNGETYNVALDNGQHYGSGPAKCATHRCMASGGNRLAYDLYSNPGRTTSWDSTNKVGDTGTGFGQVHYVYGKIVDGQNGAAAGTYDDRIIVTVEY